MGRKKRSKFRVVTLPDLFTCRRLGGKDLFCPLENIYLRVIEVAEREFRPVVFDRPSPQPGILLEFLERQFPEKFAKIRFPETTGIGIKPVSAEGTKRLVRAAIQYAVDNNRSSVTLVHKGNIMKYTEGSFRDWGYQLAKEEFGAEDLDGGPWQIIRLDNGREIIIKDVIA